jgi:hypothetical protein
VLGQVVVAQRPVGQVDQGVGPALPGGAAVLVALLAGQRLEHGQSGSASPAGQLKRPRTDPSRARGRQVPPLVRAASSSSSAGSQCVAIWCATHRPAGPGPSRWRPRSGSAATPAAHRRRSAPPAATAPRPAPAPAPPSSTASTTSGSSRNAPATRNRDPRPATTSGSPRPATPPPTGPGPARSPPSRRCGLQLPAAADSHPSSRSRWTATAAIRACSSLAHRSDTGTPTTASTAVVSPASPSAMRRT